MPVIQGSSIASFTGLNNVSDPMHLSMRSLVIANNIDITDTGAIAKREGYALSQSGGRNSLYSTSDFTRAYVVQGNALKTLEGVTIATLSSTAEMFWCEVNTNVLFSNGIDAGIITADNTVLPWRWNLFQSPTLSAATGNLPAGLYRVLCTMSLPDGRETGACDPIEIELTEGQSLQITGIPQEAGCVTNVYIAPDNSTVFSLFMTTSQTALVWNHSPDDLGRDFQNDKFDQLPLGVECIQEWRGRVYVSLYMPSEDQTAIFYSEPLAGYLFNLAESFFIVPGHVHMLATHDTALVIGTQARIYAYDGQQLARLADYGVVPGAQWCKDENRILMWTARGVCQFPSFRNLTMGQVSVAPGVRAGCCVIQRGGQKRFVAAIQQGDSPFNAL